MIYILAGADCTGKSTCFEELRRYLGNQALFIKESCTDSTIEKIARLERAKELAKSERLVIYDRATVLDDFIYNPIFAQAPSVFTTRDIEAEVTEFLRTVKIIYFTCTDTVLADRMFERGDEYVTFSDVTNIKQNYQDFFKKAGIVPYTIDTTTDTCASVAAKVMRIVWHKDFRLAHIVPRDTLFILEDKNYTMCLANIVQKSEEYARFYQGLAQRDDVYVLLDNGAAESDQISNKDLIECYELIKPNEVVLPDTLCDGDDTLEKGRCALKEFKEHFGSLPPFTYMGVPQGRTFAEWCLCAEQMFQWPEIHSLGVSKFLPIVTQHEYVRYYAVEFIEHLMKKYQRYDIEVHLLGCDERPEVIRKIAKAFPFVRGCDSAYGYICTQAKVDIYSDTRRPAGEIDFIEGKPYYEKLSKNLTDLEISMGVYNNSYNESWKE